MYLAVIRNPSFYILHLQTQLACITLSINMPVIPSDPSTFPAVSSQVNKNEGHSNDSSQEPLKASSTDFLSKGPHIPDSK